MPFVPNQAQARFLQTAEWGLSSPNSRGTGRSTVMAWQALKLAARGHTIHLIDPSTVFIFGNDPGLNRDFADIVKTMARSLFPQLLWEHSIQDNTFRFTRLRDTPPPPPPPDIGERVVEPVIQEYDFEDDGSLENID